MRYAGEVPVPAPATPRLWVPALVALVLLGLHFAGHASRGEWGALLWLSNAATLLLAVACLWPSARGVGVALAWLALSAVLWTVDVAHGAAVDSAALTHVGSFGVAIWAARKTETPRGIWVWATIALAVVLGASRALTDPALNVNLAFQVAPGWDGTFASHAPYLVLLFVVAAAIFFLVERAARLDARRAQAVATALADYAVLPLILGGAVTAAWFLLRTPLPMPVTSSVAVGVAVPLMLVLERVRPERPEYRRLDQPLLTEAAHFFFDYNLGYALALGACSLVTLALRAVRLPPLWPTAWPMVMQVVLAVVLAEGVSYWQHRLFHRVPRLWRFHLLHHAGERLNLLRAGRFHFVDIGPGAFLVFLPLAVLQAPAPVIAYTSVLSGVLGVLQHGNLRMRTPPFVDRWLCTPAVHRVHHSRDAGESNANFGTAIMIFDRLFGSWVAPSGPGPSAVGVDGPPLPKGFWAQIADPFRRETPGSQRVTLSPRPAGDTLSLDHASTHEG
jgi:sterol desaturase/sphingolipid hydroxylase (fatty acid hydroxylase superfamily)